MTRELGLYPDFIGHDPQFARELLQSIRRTLDRGEELGPQARKYLSQAITKILNGLPADRALYLTRRRGRQLGWRKRKPGALAQLQRDLYKKAKRKRTK